MRLIEHLVHGDPDCTGSWERTGVLIPTVHCPECNRWYPALPSVTAAAERECELERAIGAATAKGAALLGPSGDSHREVR